MIRNTLFAPPRSRSRSTTLHVGVALLPLLLLLSLAPSVAADETAVTITVAWDEDGKGFEVTSSKAISNVIVRDCHGMDHKHEAFEANETVWYHDEGFPVEGIWVKSGDNGNGSGPAGAGDWFANPHVLCDETTSDGPPSGACPEDAMERVADFEVHVTRGDVTAPVDGLHEVLPGDLLSIELLIAQGCEDVLLSLVSYETEGKTLATASPFVHFDSAKATFDEGNGTLGPIDVPACHLGLWFVVGDVAPDADVPGAYDDRTLATALGGEPCPTECTGVTLTSLTATDDGNALVFEPLPNATAYSIHRATDGGFQEIATLGPDATTFLDSNVTPDLTYTYRVTAIHGGAPTTACNEMSVTAIPFFPNAMAPALAVLGILGIYAIAAARKRR